MFRHNSSNGYKELTDKGHGSLNGAELEYIMGAAVESGYFSAWCFDALTDKLIFFWASHENNRKNTFERNTSADRMFYDAVMKPLFHSFLSHGGLNIYKEKKKKLADKMLTYLGSDVRDNILYDCLSLNEIIFFFGKELLEGMPTSKYVISNSELEIISKTCLSTQNIVIEAREFFSIIPSNIFNISSNADTLYDQYYGPRLENHSGWGFFWPWQSAEDANGMRTLSVVFDVRNSSTALLNSDNLVEFASFIEGLIEKSRNLIRESGGYFDKEIGDGVVAHFPVGKGFENELARIDGIFSNIIDLCISLDSECRKYGKRLSVDLGNFGFAGGVHVDSSVWVRSSHSIRAIGKSVVNATRYCSNAKAGEISFSLEVLKLIENSHIYQTKYARTVERRPIFISEIAEKAAPNGFFYSTRR